MLFSLCTTPSLVLIETYWNVNTTRKRWYAIFRRVLIETYWNVNTNLHYQKYFQTLGINRNILECKYFIFAVEDYPLLKY